MTAPHRLRPAKLLTLSPEAWSALDALAARWGMTRSRMVEHLVREATEDEERDRRRRARRP